MPAFTFGGHAIKNCSITDLFNATNLCIKEMDAAETELDLTLAIVRLRLRIEEDYELEPAVA
ncbi:MAG: hypothetical protein IIB38_11475 [Candidatus Hydrogenedentes bacterium]|nr:hypothetical protein [Candidatus Hydrogenedentota bacterium]